MLLSLHWRKKKMPLKNFLWANAQVTDVALVVRLHSSSDLFFCTTPLKILQLFLTPRVEWALSDNTAHLQYKVLPPHRRTRGQIRPQSGKNAAKQNGDNGFSSTKFPDFILRVTDTLGTLLPGLNTVSESKVSIPLLLLLLLLLAVLCFQTACLVLVSAKRTKCLSSPGN